MKNHVEFITPFFITKNIGMWYQVRDFDGNLVAQFWNKKDAQEYVKFKNNKDMP